MPTILLAFGSAIVGAIAGSLLTWYLQRRWTPDPTKEIGALRKQVGVLSEQVATFQQHTDAMDKERAEFEHFPLEISLQQGAPQNYMANVKNESEREISIETIQILRGDAANDCPLTEAVKPKPTDNWRLSPGLSKQLSWAPQHDPVMMMRSLDPSFSTTRGTVLPIILALTFKVDGKMHSKRRTQQVVVSGNLISQWGP